MRSVRPFLLLAVLLLTSCAQFLWVAKQAQGLTRHQMVTAAVELAHDTRCDEQPTTIEAAEAALTVEIRETRITRGKQMALPWVLLAKRGFSKLPDAARLRKLRHELVHYCQRATIPGYDQLWLLGYIDRPCVVEGGKCVGIVPPRSDFRVAFEFAAFRVSPGQIPSDFVDEYLAHDLDPADLARVARDVGALP